MNHHAVTVATPRSLGQAAAPYLLQRDDDDFIAAMLAELPTAAGRTKLAATRATTRNTKQLLKLFQPVQRRFHVALIEAWCETAGRPRIDPTRVEAAGLVLRRVRHRDGRRVLEGWMRADGVVRGWVAIDQLGDDNADPSPLVRQARRDTGVIQIDRALRRLAANHPNAALQEDVAPMFVAPPDVCTHSGQTLYYGVVPTASAELAQAGQDLAAVFEGFGAESDAFRDHLVQPLRGQSYNFPTPPLSGRRFSSGWQETLLKALPPSNEHRFLQLLRQVATEFDAFGTTPPSRALMAELEQIPLTYVLQSGEVTPRTVSAATFLSAATRVLLEGEAGTVEMPANWPALSTAARQRLANAMSEAMRERFKAVKGRPGRFDEPDAQYVVRAFVRLKPEGSCPSKTVWSDYTEPFVIAPWYEGAGDPVQITLPNINKSLLKSLKPNVAFVVPPALQGLLSGNPEDLAKGKGQHDESLELGWICSFSLPTITLCAFICLNIFLSLLDLIFHWMMFIKICIPFPKLKSGGSS